MQPGQQGTGDQSSNFFWLIALFAGTAIILWFYESKYIVMPCFWIRAHEIDWVIFLAKHWVPVAHFLHLPVPNLKRIAEMQYYIQTANPAYVKWGQFAAINAEIGEWTRFPVMLILVMLALFGYFTGASQFRHTYSMKTLRDLGQEVWPQITPVISLDLIKENIDKGPWAMARLPLDFSRDNDLLVMKTVAGKKVWILKQKPAYRLFALQVGPLWKGLDALPIHLKALTLVFLARATGQRPIARAILSQIAASAATGKLDFTGVSEKLQEFKDQKLLHWAEKRHAYVLTVMATLLEIARSDGVLASAEFLWLKPVDRRMWFMLNTVGRSAAFIEIAGAYSHWKAEKKVGRALKTPMVKGAVDALEEGLLNILYVEEEDQWRTRSAD